MIKDFKKENVKWFKDERGLPGCFYKIKIPSVTTIISETIPDPGFEQWVEEQGKDVVDKIMQAAAYRGSALHCFLEIFITTYTKTKDITEALKETQINAPILLNKEGIPDNKIAEGRDLFYKFYYSNYPNIFLNMLYMELSIYSPTLFYRGKLDIIYNDPIFGLCVTDFKSSNGLIIKNSTKEIKYKYQIAAYVYAVEEMFLEKQIKINKGSILCIDKKSDILQEIVLKGDELTKYKNDWHELVKQYHIKNKNDFFLNT